MGDLFLNMGRNRAAKKIVEKDCSVSNHRSCWRRASGPWEAHPLAERSIGFGSATESDAAVHGVLTGLGATVEPNVSEDAVHGLVFDARGIDSVSRFTGAI